MDVPEIFQDSSYKSSMHFNLSTSQVPCKADLSMGFGPAVLDGYGICYNPKEDHILFSISAHKSCPETDAALFSLKLQEALLSMQSILQKADSLSSKLWKNAFYREVRSHNLVNPFNNLSQNNFCIVQKW